MKKLKLIYGLLGISLFCACSEKELENVNEGEVKNEARYMAIEIKTPPAEGSSLGTRAATDPPTDSDFEDGNSNENKVNSLRFYFFNADGAPVSISAGGKNFVDAKPADIQDDGKDGANVEKKLKAIIVVTPESVANVTSMIAIANYDKAGLQDSKNYSLADFRTYNGNYGEWEKEGTPNFMMSSSSYADAAGQVSRAYVRPENMCATEEEAIAKPVEVYIERVLAKVSFKTEWRKQPYNEDEKNIPAMETEDNVNYEGNKYMAVKAKDGEGNVIQDTEGHDVYILFTKWDVTAKADKSNLVKRVNSTTNWQTLSGYWFWNDPTRHRSYWGVNPRGIQLQFGKYNDIKQVIPGYTYCQENAADNFANGTKEVYDPQTQITNRTQVIIAAVLVTLEDGEDGKTAKPIGLANWSGQYYTESGVKTQMLALVNRDIYTKEGEGDDVSYKTITEEEVELVTAQVAGEANDDSENSPRYLSFLKLTTEAEKKTFYHKNDRDEWVPYSTAEVNELLAKVPGARVWHTGLTYYYADIRHLSPQSIAGYGRFGVVRNHHYQVVINSVVGLGTPVLNPDEVIIPQIPKEDDESYVAARINILSWRKVENNNDLNWEKNN